MISVAIDCRTFRIPINLQNCTVVKLDLITPLNYIHCYRAFFVMIEAKPNTKLRSEVLSAFYHKGYAGPNYNLDDISAYVTKHENSLSLSFWDMSCTINKKDIGYTEILNAL